MSRPASSSRLRRSLVALSILALGVAGFGVSRHLSAQETAKPETLRPVLLLEVSPPSSSVSRQFYGQVVARQTVDLAFQVGGQLVELPVRNGQTVSQGDLLAKLDIEPFDRALDRAKLNLTQAQREFDRVQQLARSNVASEARLDETQTALDLAKLGLRDARDARDDATLSADFDGLVAQRLVANFSTVAQGTPVLRLHDMSQTRIAIDVPERLLRSAGDLTGITFSADLGEGLSDIPVTIAEYTAETSGVSQSYTVELALPKIDGFTPLPGRTATVTATLPLTSDSPLTLPVTALLNTAKRTTQVMVYEPADGATGAVHAIPVTVVSREGADLGVVADEALEPGMEIVATGAHLLTEGQQVRRFDGFSEIN